MSAPGAIDLDAYLQRTGARRPAAPTVEALQELHARHAANIPFENLDIMLGRPIALDLSAIEAKLVAGRRGGYCFEQNALFATVLEALGYTVTRLAARVVVGATGPTARTHMALRVEAEGRSWLADVGFGADTLLEPHLLENGAEARRFGADFRLQSDGSVWTLAVRHDAEWIDQYRFTLEPHFPIDFAVANHYVSTHPDSRFVRTLTAQTVGAEGRKVLRDRELHVRPPGGALTWRETASDPDHLLELLRREFGLHFAPGTRFARPAFPDPGV